MLKSAGTKKESKLIKKPNLYQINVYEKGINYWSQRDFVILLYSSNTKYNH